MFDGKVATSKSYNIKRRGGDATNRNRGNFVEQARADREARALEKLRQRSATSIQASARRWRTRLLTFTKLRAEFDTSVQNIVKMTNILSAAGKKFLVPSTVMLKLLRIVGLVLNLRNGDDMRRLNDIFGLTLDYASLNDAKIEIGKAGLSPSWAYLFGKLFKFGFETLTGSMTDNDMGTLYTEELINKAKSLIKMIPEIADLLQLGVETSSILSLATTFVKEECECLRLSIERHNVEAVSILMPSMVAIMKKCLSLSSSSVALPPHARGIWHAIIGIILSLPEVSTVSLPDDLMVVLGTDNLKGWSLCLELLCHSGQAFTNAVKRNVVANYFTYIRRDPSSAQTYMKHAFGSSSAPLLLLVNEILEPGGERDSSSSSTQSILSALADKEFTSNALRGALQGSSVDSAVAVLSLYGRLLCIAHKDERATQAILGSRFHYHDLNKSLWHFLSNTVSLKVSSGGDGVLCGRLPSAENSDSETTLMLVLLLFCRCMWHELFTMDDEDFLRSDCVVGNTQIEAMVTLLNKLLLRLYRLEITADSGAPHGSLGSSGGSASAGARAVLGRELREHATRLFNAVFKIDDRRHFFSDSTIWQWAAVLEQDLVLGDEAAVAAAVAGGPPAHDMASAVAGGAAAMDEEEDELEHDDSMEVDSHGGGLSGHQRAQASPLRNAITWRALLAHPQVLPFSRRVVIFQDLLDEDKAIQMSGARTMDGWLGMGGVSVDIDRNDIVNCAYSEINRLNSDELKGRLKVQFISKQGYTEAGIDGGGLFKEFMDDLVSNLFSEELGLFKGTEEQLLVPNPAALDAQRMELFKFAGKMLGKALYESLLVDPQFSDVFLNVLLGRANHFDDLVFLDQQLYGNLKQLKHMDAASVTALGLTFEAQRSGDGKITTHELVPGGSSIPVTADNVTEYLHRFAHFKLNLEFQRASKHFNVGLHELIPENWIRLFSPRELQQLISGQKKGIDVADMMRNVNYAGGYAEAQPYVQAFWRIVGEMTLDQQGELLKFITSCSRQPLRGFSQLTHRMCIQRVPQYSQEAFESASTVLTARLPSAATCVNLLKLPEYDNPETLKEKLLYAISHNTGFELS